MGKHNDRPMMECKNCGQRLVYTVPVFKRSGGMTVGLLIFIVLAFSGALLYGLLFGGIFFLLGLANGPYVVKSFPEENTPRK